MIAEKTISCYDGQLINNEEIMQTFFSFKSLMNASALQDINYFQLLIERKI
jgi:hypothetical protein